LQAATAGHMSICTANSSMKAKCGGATCVKQRIKYPLIINNN
jgi:hypothetical protein